MSIDKSQINHLYETKALFEKLNNASGNEKLPVIREIFQHDGAAEILKLLINPMVTFGVGEKSLGQQETCVPNPFKSLRSVCESLSSKTGISSKDISEVLGFLNDLPNDLQDFCRQIITKTLTLGATSKTINKAMGTEVIPEFRCMLANKYMEHQRAVEGERFTVTQKLDGIRCLLSVSKENGIRFYTRQGHVIEGLVELEKEAAELPDGFVFDGELLVSNAEQMESKDAYKATVKKVRTLGIKKDVVFHVFDMISQREFAHRKGTVPYFDRRQSLDGVIAPMNLPHIQVLPILYAGTNADMILTCLDDARKLHQEGVMVNIDIAPYVFGRTNNLLKVKVMQDCDLRIIGVEQGTGKFSNTLGAIIVDYKGNLVGVGSGFTDVQRWEIWNNAADYIGRVATIQYFEETESDGVPSLRFPVFKEIREEGKEVSYS